MPWFILDITLTRPSMIGPAMAVPIKVAMRGDTFVAPTAETEKL